jgi:membrane protein
LADIDIEMTRATLETTHVRTERLIPAFIAAFLKSLPAVGMRTIQTRGDATQPASAPRRAHMIDATVNPGNNGRPIEGAGTRPAERNPIEHARAFLDKFGKDWCMNLCSLLAYNFLGAIFPLLLGVLAIGALFLPPSLLHQVGTNLNGAIPAEASGSQGGLNIDFNNVLDNFRHASGPAAVISFLALLWTGSSLFGVMENCFSIIYRTKDRDFIWQKLMSIAMIIIFAILTPLTFIASSISGSYQQLSQAFSGIPGLSYVFGVGGFVIGAAFSFVLFLLIYMVVPNLKIGWSHAWPGALVAGVLFEAATLGFPAYETHFGGKSQFGAVAGLLAVLTLWFWVISLILILGAEVNSYFVLGQRATADDLPGVLRGIKLHQESRRGQDVASPQAQQRVMEDVQRASEKKRAGFSQQ